MIKLLFTFGLIGNCACSLLSQIGDRYDMAIYHAMWVLVLLVLNKGE